MNPLKVVLTALLVFSCALPAAARTWRVRVDGSGDVPTIVAAVAAAADGDSILVAPGTYTWTNQSTIPSDYYAMIQFDAGKDYINLVSEAGPHATIVDAEGAGRVLVTKGLNHLTVDGFTIRGGYTPPLATPSGGGLFLHISHDVFKNCIIRDNTATYGGGAWVGGLAEPQFIDCEFTNNNAVAGGALFLVNTSTPIDIRGCNFHHNYATGGGGAIYMVHILGIFEENVFAFNEAPQGGAVFMRSMWSATFSRCTFAGNGGAEAGAFYVLASPAIRVENSIVGFGIEGPPYFVSSNSAVTFSCTDSYHNPVTDALPAVAIDGGGNFSADPLFCASIYAMDYRLAVASPCLPGNHPGGTLCARIGAFDAGCGPVPTRGRTWGQIKAIYR